MLDIFKPCIRFLYHQLQMFGSNVIGKSNCLFNIFNH